MTPKPPIKLLSPKVCVKGPQSAAPLFLLTFGSFCVILRVARNITPKLVKEHQVFKISREL